MIIIIIVIIATTITAIIIGLLLSLVIIVFLYFYLCSTIYYLLSSITITFGSVMIILAFHNLFMYTYVCTCIYTRIDLTLGHPASYELFVRRLAWATLQPCQVQALLHHQWIASRIDG